MGCAQGPIQSNESNRGVCRHAELPSFFFSMRSKSLSLSIMEWPGTKNLCTTSSNIPLSTMCSHKHIILEFLFWPCTSQTRRLTSSCCRASWVGPSVGTVLSRQPHGWQHAQARRTSQRCGRLKGVRQSCVHSCLM